MLNILPLYFRPEQSQLFVNTLKQLLRTSIGIFISFHLSIEAVLSPQTIVYFEKILKFT